MVDIASLVRSESALDDFDYHHLLNLLSEWQLLSDLSFADLILWVPTRRSYNDWPDGYIVMSQIRPTTAATLFTQDMLGEKIKWGDNPQIDHSMKTGDILRDVEPTMVGDLLVKVETIPVNFRNRTIAVISRHRNAEQMRSASRLEINYREIAHKIYLMIAQGNFPIPNSIYVSESAPRVGDGLIRLNPNGEIAYCSPNARSALSRAGWSGELIGVDLGNIFESIKTHSTNAVDESFGDVFISKNVRRIEFENARGTFDLLTLPLIENADIVGVVVLIHNITELRRRDKALISKDATIKEIHHRVKNNLQTVSAILRLQSRRVEDETASAALAEAVRRVASIAIVHETLAGSTTGKVDFDEVISRIIHNAIELGTHPINLVQEGKFGTFESIIATPLALVLTELIHNALEHGLDKKGDQLRVLVARSESQCIVKVLDNGEGLPENFDWEKSSNLGLQIVRTLTENELKGSISLKSVEHETVATLEFPISNF